MNPDRAQLERMKKVASRFEEGESLSVAEIFSSRRVIETIDREKLFLESFKLEQILAVLPFSPNLYVGVCPRCIDGTNFHEFSALAKAGLILPILKGRYEDYDPQVVEVICRYDHMCSYEYRFYRSMAVSARSQRALCEHCVGERRNELVKLVKGRRGAPEIRDRIDQIFSCLHPYVHPDYTLLESLEEALRARNELALTQLSLLAGRIQSLRSAQAFDSSLLLDASDLESLPAGVAADVDNSKSLALDLKRQMSEGLGLVVPVNLPIETFIGLVRDLQPQIVALLNEEVCAAKGPGANGPEGTMLKIADINREIERVQTLKRYAAVEVAVAIFKRHQSLAASALIAAALGLGNWGCASAVAIGAATDFVKKRLSLRGEGQWLEKSEPVQRLAQMIMRDLQPGLDKLVAKYAGAGFPAIRVMSLRRSIARRASVPFKRIA
jgi:hypothetical protein